MIASNLGCRDVDLANLAKRSKLFAVLVWPSLHLLVVLKGTVSRRMLIFDSPSLCMRNCIFDKGFQIIAAKVRMIAAGTGIC
jgi:hypothetical protein